jgi:hypothetical protein
MALPRLCRATLTVADVTNAENFNEFFDRYGSWLEHLHVSPGTHPAGAMPGVHAVVLQCLCANGRTKTLASVPAAVSLAAIATLPAAPQHVFEKLESWAATMPAAACGRNLGSRRSSERQRSAPSLGFRPSRS